MQNILYDIASNKELIINCILYGMILFIVIVSFITFFAMVRIKKEKDTRNKFKEKSKNTDYPQHFNELYSKISKIHSEYFKKDKKNIKEIIYTIIFVILFALCIYGLIPTLETPTTDDDMVYAEIIIVLIITYICLLSFELSPSVVSKKDYKEIIIKPFIEGITSNIVYSPEVTNVEEIEKIYSSAHFEETRYNRFLVDDYIKDTKNNITMYDIDKKHVVRTSKGGEDETYIFQGMFAFYDLNTTFNSTIKIVKNKSTPLTSDKLIKLDNNEFEKYFDVYCEDRVLATRMLTADVMEKIVEFYNIFNLTFEIVVMNNKLYLRFFTSPMFENSRFSNKLHDKKDMFVYYNIILFIQNITLSISKELNNFDI